MGVKKFTEIRKIINTIEIKLNLKKNNLIKNKSY